LILDSFQLSITLKILLAHLFRNHETKWRFLTVGAWNAIFAYLVFVGLDIVFAFLFSKRYLAYMLAQLLSSILGIVNAFIFHKYITFKSRVRGKGILVEFVRFFSTCLFSIIIGLLLLPFFVEIIGLDPKISRAILIPIIAIINYFGHSRFSFKGNEC
jgi:putative flippase GtrA